MTEVVRHLVMPGYEKAQCAILEGESVSDFLVRADWKFNLPTICVRNGLPVMRDAWSETTISGRDNVVFYSRPYKGGGGAGKAGTIGALVALIALSAFAPWAAGTLFATGTFGYFATAAAITLVGGFLISSYLLPKPASNDSQPVSQLYSLTGAGNTAAPFQTVPVQYGRLKQTPMYASIPWTDYVGNDAYLNILLATGQGKYDLEQILIDDTVLWDHITGTNPSFTGVSLQICDPGVAFTLFPANVTTSVEVDGIELASTTPVGYFAANQPGTTAYQFAFDFVFPGGLQGTDGGDGSKFAISVHLFADIQQIDDTGTPIAGSVQVVDQVITWNTNQPQRFSVIVNLAAHGLPNGRYQARVHRNPGPAPDTTHNVDVVLWQALRAYLIGSNTYPSTSVVGIRILATSQLSGSSSKQFAVIQTRKLPVWNGSTFVEQATKNAFWALYDAATNTDYGAGWPVSKVDFQAIVTQATNADTRGDTFNYRFDSAITFMEAFDKITASNRAKVRWLGDVLSVIRDEWQSIPQMLIGDQQIVRGSLEVDYQINDDSNTDSVQGQFLNEDTWQPAQLQYPKDNAPTFVAVSPAQIQLEGITNKDQMYRELQFWYKQSQLRRIKVRLDTEHDGRILSFGSVVKVQSQLPNKWGVSGEIVSYNTGTKVLTLDRTLTNEAGQHYIELRDKRGRYFGPVKGTLTTPGNLVTLDPTDLSTVETSLGYTIETALDRMDGAEPPSFVWGLAGNLSRQCIVLSGKPNDHKVSLELAVDTLAVHDDTASDVPIIPTVPPINDPRVPTIANLVASFKQGVVEPVLTATWWPSKGAQYYRAQVSYDSGQTWTRLNDNLQDPNLTAVVSLANLTLRVAGVGQLQGPWAQVDVTAPTVTLGPDTVSPDSFQTGLKDYIMKQLADNQSQISQVMQQIASIAAEHDAARTSNVNSLRSATHNALASVDTLTTTIADNEVAFAQYQVTVTAQFAGQQAQITTNAEAIATGSGAVAALYSLTLDVNGYVSGFQSINTGLTAEFQVVADKFVIAKPGATGGSPLQVFSLGTSGGVASLVLNGNLYADGTITAQALSVSNLSAITANMGTITTGKIQSVSGNFVIDAANERIEIWS